MIEYISEFSEETEKEIMKAEREIKSGKTVTMEEVKKKIGMSRKDYS